MAARILVVDDERHVRFYLEETLDNEGYDVVSVESGEAALGLIEPGRFELALLDLKLKGISGIEVLKNIMNTAPDTAVIMLTAHASVETAVEALRWGAHDYLFKPFKTHELLESVRTGLLKQQRAARQRQLLNQLEQSLTQNLEEIRATVVDARPPSTPDKPSTAESASPDSHSKRYLARGALIVDLMRHEITVDGQLIELSPTEFDLLVCLITEAPRVLSPQELVRCAQGYESELWEARDTVRYHIYRIRQKVETVSGRTDLIETVRGIGYTINEDFS
jgi:two-component system alkaline phosphatase synthesis response regulator PhoP